LKADFDLIPANQNHIMLRIKSQISSLFVEVVPSQSIF